MVAIQAHLRWFAFLNVLEPSHVGFATDMISFDIELQI
jgi:hypothetical protein